MDGHARSAPAHEHVERCHLQKEVTDPNGVPPSGGPTRWSERTGPGKARRGPLSRARRSLPCIGPPEERLAQRWSQAGLGVLTITALEELDCLSDL